MALQQGEQYRCSQCGAEITVTTEATGDLPANQALRCSCGMEMQKAVQDAALAARAATMANGTEHRDHGSVAQAQPWFTKTFVTRVLRSLILQSEGRLGVLTRTAHITGTPCNATELSALWNRSRQQIVKERHEPDSRIPEIAGGDILELEDVAVVSLANPGFELHLDNIVLFTEEIVAMHITGRPESRKAATLAAAELTQGDGRAQEPERLVSAVGGARQ